MWRVIVAFLIAGVTLATQSAHALRISPLVVEISPSGTGSTARIRVENTSTKDMPLEVVVFRIDVEPDGSVVRTPADEDFFVFPPQAVVPAGEPQVIRVQWLGDPQPETSSAYFVTINQLPIDLEAGVSAIQFVYSVSALVNVVPSGVDADEAVGELSVEADPETGAPLLVAEVLNTGSRYFASGQYNWRLTGVDGQRMTLRQQDVTQSIGIGMVPPVDGRRVFRVPLPADAPTEVVSLDFDAS